MRKTYDDAFKLTVAKDIGHEEPNFTESAGKFNITPKQAKHYWLEWQAGLVKEYRVENEKLLLEVRRLKELLKLKNQIIKKRIE